MHMILIHHIIGIKNIKQVQQPKNHQIFILFNRKKQDPKKKDYECSHKKHIKSF